MKKVYNVKATCHCEEHSATRQSNEIASHSFAMTEQCGRSMVEMLGVLAVIGVLSVAGIAGYSSAMNKHRANEILNEASKRAVMVAGQAMAGKTSTISLSEFGNNAVSGSTFGTEAKVENNQIKLTLSGVESSICTKMKAALGDNTVMAVDNDCTIIAFNADMTKGVAKPTSCNPACTGGKECVNGTCQCPDDKPLWIGSTCVAKATCTENQWYNAKTNGCEASKQSECGKKYLESANEYDEYYWPQLNYCGGEVDCGDAESGLREYSFAGHVDINDEAQTCACPTGTTAFLESGYYTRCCPNTIPIIWGHCLNEATLRSCSRERLYCSGDYPDFYSGIVNPTGGSDGYSCIDEVICCPHDLETGADGNKWCCPTGKTLTCNGEDCSCQ